MATAVSSAKHDPAMPTVHTIGHSDHPIARFIALLAGCGVDAVADVRSAPWSRRHPQFRRAALEAALGEAGLVYVFLGRELGARPADRACYREGCAAYELIAATAAFGRGLARIAEGSARHRIALMCAEREPLDCHRTVLVARALAARGFAIRHILADGRVEAHAETERRLLRLTGQETGDLLGDDPLARAYEIRGAEICYREAR